MANDTLKQAGKTLRKNKEDTDFNTRRYSYNFPLIERLRDSFDSTHPFIMEFTINRADNAVSITLIFTEAFVP